MPKTTHRKFIVLSGLIGQSRRRPTMRRTLSAHRPAHQEGIPP
jgi:hypothetical protein